MTENKLGMFTKISNALPVVTIILIVAGYYDLHIYYQKFGVNISSFLDPTEIIFAFSTIFHAVVALVALFILGALGMSAFEKAQGIPNEPSSQFDLDTLIDGHENLRKITVKGIIGLGLIFASIILIIVLFLNQLYVSDFILLVCSVSIIAIYWFTTKIFQIRSNLRILRNPAFTMDHIGLIKIQLTKLSISDYASLVLILLIYFNVRSEIRYQNVIDGFPKYAVLLEGPDKVKSKSEFYIGSTRNYIFMYDSALKTVRSYPERDVKRMEIKQIRIGI